MEPEVNAAFFSHPDTVLEYARAVQSVGLWASEEIWFGRFAKREAKVLELGCGAGRISFGLWERGWRDILATDFAAPMVAAAEIINATRKTGISFAQADATALDFAEESFDVVIFGFNGFLMIPGPERRKQALREIRRVLRPSGVFLFTGHDRGVARNAAHWAEEKARWGKGKQDPALDAFGDYNHATPQGRMFIHAADAEEMRDLLATEGFDVLETAMRSEIALESAAVREFSDDTRFWAAEKR